MKTTWTIIIISIASSHFFNLLLYVTSKGWRKNWYWSFLQCSQISYPFQFPRFNRFDEKFVKHHQFCTSYHLTLQNKCCRNANLGDNRQFTSVFSILLLFVNIIIDLHINLERSQWIWHGLVCNFRLRQRQSSMIGRHLLKINNYF